MLSALGRLNSDLLAVYYGDEPTSPHRISSMLRESGVLLRRAHINLNTAVGQDRHEMEETQMSDVAARCRHVARHTMQPNSMCTGPCVHIPRSSVKTIRKVVEGLYGPDRTSAVKQLAHELQVRGNPTDPRLCSTGIPCAAAMFTHSGRTPSREKVAAQVLKEAKYTHDLANMVSRSRVRELEAEDSQFNRIDLSGGGVRVSDRDTVRTFFREHQLGPAPDTGDIRIALDTVVANIAPRARRKVGRDLWARWIGI